MADDTNTYKEDASFLTSSTDLTSTPKEDASFLDSSTDEPLPREEANTDFLTSTTDKAPTLEGVDTSFLMSAEALFKEGALAIEHAEKFKTDGFPVPDGTITHSGPVESKLDFCKKYFGHIDFLKEDRPPAASESTLREIFDKQAAMGNTRLEEIHSLCEDCGTLMIEEFQRTNPLEPTAQNPIETVNEAAFDVLIKGAPN